MYGLTCQYLFTDGTHVEFWGTVTDLPKTFTLKGRNTASFTFKFVQSTATEPFVSTTPTGDILITSKTTAGGFTKMPPVILTLIGLSFTAIVV